MNILMINQPINNRGDESAHKGLVRALLTQKPDVNITVLFIGANSDSVRQFKVCDERVKYINMSPVKGWSYVAKIGLLSGIYFMWFFHPTILRLRKIYTDSDYVLCAPGGICMGGFQDWRHLFFLKFAQVMGKKLVYYGRSIGPFPIETRLNRRFKTLSIEMLKYFTFCALRDSKSWDLARSLGVKFEYTIDSAFLDHPCVEIPAKISNVIGESEYMVLVPNLLIWHYAYKGVPKERILSFYSALIDILLENRSDIKIVMLPQTFNYGTYAGDDIHLFKEIQALKNDSRIVVIADRYSSDIQQCIIRNSLYLIGARYHSVVFAINNNVPFIALSYEHKISGLLQILGKEESMIDIIDMFETEQRTEAVLDSVKCKLSKVSRDTESQERAHTIAQACLQKFCSMI